MRDRRLRVRHSGAEEGYTRPPREECFREGAVQATCE
jgi:hypothetical protein